MPAGDGTGPQGRGPMTGRGMGYCAGLPFPGRAIGSLFGGSSSRGRGMLASPSTYILIGLGSLLVSWLQSRNK